MAVISIFFFVFIFGDLVWCWNACLSVRRFPRPWRIAARVGAIAFAAIQALGFLVLVFGRRLDLPLESYFPKPLIAGVYLWHCLVLLPMALLWFLGKLTRGILWIARALARRNEVEHQGLKMPSVPSPT